MKAKSNPLDKNNYPDFERALVLAKKNFSCNKLAMHKTRVIVEQIIKKIVSAMKKQSPAFTKLYEGNFNGGSIYERTKIGKADEFDIDILLKIPETLKPTLIEGNVPGFAQLQLKNPDIFVDPEILKVLKEFTDDENFLLSDKFLTCFVWKIFRNALNNFPSLIIKIKNDNYNISKINYYEPVITLAIEGTNFFVSIDLVICFVFDGAFWPGCRRNPFSTPSEFFLTPVRPKNDHIYRNRFWRLSFHLQERKIVFNRYGLKPTLRILKCIRDHFKHNVQSYAIKTIFLWELSLGNAILDQRTPDLWKAPLSCIVVHVLKMLERYLQCLNEGAISDFWSPELNLLFHLSAREMDEYKEDVTGMIRDVKTNNFGTNFLMKYSLQIK